MGLGGTTAAYQIHEKMIQRQYAARHGSRHDFQAHFSMASGTAQMTCWPLWNWMRSRYRRVLIMSSVVNLVISLISFTLIGPGCVFNTYADRCSALAGCFRVQHNSK